MKKIVLKKAFFLVGSTVVARLWNSRALIVAGYREVNQKKKGTRVGLKFEPNSLSLDKINSFVYSLCT